ncbi:hypothetical protein ONE63_000776 [Megalurothrips usitatus]|uniref:ATP-binding cassette sub-family C member Sur n=1 Tax=Megalurothrips usitatus TaxID=439358 RepID=A0AAV7Y0K7_9NEOP|nr:hypothetical protein ONE63_000776 [Megalurothrips usitatus]
MAEDTYNVMSFVWICHYVWAIPVKIGVLMLLLHYQMGISALIGAVLCVAVMTPLQFVIGKKMSINSKSISVANDERLRRINEVLHGIKVIKLSGWEEQYEKRVQLARNRELRLLNVDSLHWAVMTFLTHASSAIVTLVTFGVYMLIEKSPMPSANVFASLALFNQLTVPLFIFPITVPIIISAMVSTKRLEAFFSKPETNNVLDSRPRRGSVVSINDGNFSWSTGHVLNFNAVEVPKGGLTLVVGAIGSGKTSLLLALLGEMSSSDGRYPVRWSQDSSVAYCSQKPWLLNASVRDNILFGQPMRRRRYVEAVAACALQPDLDILPARDLTEIGERGINLSGGQKHRVGIARALYSGASTVLMDDPLSALDYQVGQHLVQEGFQKLLKQRGRTLILATHCLSLLNQADYIIAMENGKVSVQGSMAKIQSERPDLSQAWQQALTASDKAADSVRGERTARERWQLRFSRRQSRSLYRATHVTHSFPLPVDECPAAPMAPGDVGVLSAWSQPLRRTRSTIAPAPDFWRRKVTRVASLQPHDAAHRAWRLAGARARHRLHKSLLSNLLRCPVKFFDTTPIGRVIDRFSTDIAVIDKKLATSIQRLMQFLSLCLSAILVNAMLSPWFLLPALPMCLAYYIIQHFYRVSTRELHRMDSLTRAPVSSFFCETLGGLVTIRAFGKKARFMEHMLEKMDTNNNTFLLLNGANRWLGVALDYMGGVIVLISVIGSLLAAKFYPEVVSPSLVGLAVNYTLLVPIYLNWVVKFLADVEMYMGSVERVQQYAELQVEDYNLAGLKVTPTWPDYGEITFENVSLRYDENRDPVIRNLNLHIPPGQKVGLCGRTGSGKSSLVMSLFRMLDVSEGNIHMDRVDITKLSLQLLRSRLSIIPQDIVMFSGSIRDNLDPKGLYSDEKIWKCLDLAQLKGMVEALPGGLSAAVKEGGENLSVGTRQLFCLARAILQNAAVLVMDEATSSVDPATEHAFLSVALNAFAHRTVIIIAHRLSTLLDCDRVLVLEGGKVIEDGSPSQLLRFDNGVFSLMLRAGS